MNNHRRYLIAASCLLILSACASNGPRDRSTRYGHDNRDDRAYDSRREFARLAQDLDERSFRAHEMAERQVASFRRGEQELYPRLHRFSDQVHVFRGRLDAGELTGGRLRESVDRLTEDARDTDRSVRQGDVLPEAREQWQSALRVLDQMVVLVGR